MKRCNANQPETCDAAGAWQASDGDCTPPTILSITPSNNATGVRKDAVIVVTFSEPMNRQTTEAAFSSPNLPAVKFSWNASGTIATITPTSPLDYAAGEVPSTAAKAYSFSFGTVATDVAGNRLAAHSHGFSTLRRLTRSLRVLIGQSGYAGKDFANFNTMVFYIGPADQGMRTFQGIATFGLHDVPAGAEVESAVARFYRPPSTNPGDEPDQTVPILFEHIRHYADDASGLFYSAALRQLGTLVSQPGPGWKEIDVTPALVDDLANRALTADRTRYRMYTTAAYGSGNYFELNEANLPTIRATYLVP
jgi:hypothetical protein